MEMIAIQNTVEHDERLKFAKKKIYFLFGLID